MRKQFLFLFVSLIVANTIQAQTRGTKVGYIDMEYILQNVPNYTEAQNQLEQKAQKWKLEIETKKIEINKLKDALKAEKALLTKGLIEEREAEIKFLEDEMLDYQQKRFGPNGDLMNQKSGLTKPIQDQVFTAVQDIAEAKKYDFIFDKASDLTMLFAAKRFDISDQIIRVLNRTEKREELTKKQLKEEEAKQNKEDAIDENPVLAERKKSLEGKKAARDLIIANRIVLLEQRKQEAEDRKIQLAAERQAKKEGKAVLTKTTTPPSAIVNSNELQKEVAKTTAAEARQQQIDARAKTLEDRKNTAEANKKAAEEKRKQTLEERESKKSGTAVVVPTTAIVNPIVNSNEQQKEVAKITAAEAKQQQIDARTKTLEDRKKAVEETKKASEEKRKQILEERETKKTNKVAPANTNSKAAATSSEQVKETKETGTISDKTSKEEAKPATVSNPAKETTKLTAEETKQKLADARVKTLEERQKVLDERKKAAEEKRKKMLEDKEAAKKAIQKN